MFLPACPYLSVGQQRQKEKQPRHDGNLCSPKIQRLNPTQPSPAGGCEHFDIAAMCSLPSSSFTEGFRNVKKWIRKLKRKINVSFTTKINTAGSQVLLGCESCKLSTRFANPDTTSSLCIPFLSSFLPLHPVVLHYMLTVCI